MGISLGVVGLGAFGCGFVASFRDHPLVDRIALCDLDPERLASASRDFQIEETYPSLDAICASDLQALAIITQHWMHAPQCVQAMEAGKDVYSAVPTAFSHTDPDEALEQCDRLVETVKRTGQRYMLGETTYYRPETMFCRRKAAEGAFGEFVYGEGEYFHDLTHGLIGVSKHRWGPKWTPHVTGGIPMFYPTHGTAGVISVMGAHVTEVSARGWSLPGDGWWREDTMSGNLMSNEVALYAMSNGTTMRHAEMRRIGTPGRETFRLYGTKGSFESDFGGKRWATLNGVEPVDVSACREPLPEELKTDLGGHGGSHAYLVHEFVQSVAEERHPATNVWEAVRYLAPGLVAHKSAMRDGEVMKVPDWGDAPTA